MLGLAPNIFEKSRRPLHYKVVGPDINALLSLHIAAVESFGLALGVRVPNRSEDLSSELNSRCSPPLT